MRQKAIPKDRRLNHDRDERKRNRKVILRLKPSTPKTSIHFISPLLLIFAPTRRDPGPPSSRSRQD